MRKPLNICCRARPRPFIGHRQYTIAFTLVELLVVVALIAVLIAILLPVLGKVRESANQIKCMSNLRQLSAAFIMYANNNRERLPAAGVDLGPPDGVGPLPDDWIYLPPSRDVNQSAIAPYLGVRGTALEALLRCPSDDLTGHWAPQPVPSAIRYPYSYAMNYLLDGHSQDGRDSWRWPTPYSQVRHPAEKILLAEPDERGLLGGSWFPGYRVSPTLWMLAYGSAILSIRHDRTASLPDPIPQNWLPPEAMPNPGHRGNVAFCDAHVEFVPRLIAHSQAHADPRY